MDGRPLSALRAEFPGQIVSIVAGNGSLASDLASHLDRAQAPCLITVCGQDSGRPPDILELPTALDALSHDPAVSSVLNSASLAFVGASPESHGKLHRIGETAECVGRYFQRGKLVVVFDERGRVSYTGKRAWQMAVDQAVAGWLGLMSAYPAGTSDQENTLREGAVPVCIASVATVSRLVPCFLALRALQSRGPQAGRKGLAQKRPYGSQAPVPG